MFFYSRRPVPGRQLHHSPTGVQAGAGTELEHHISIPSYTCFTFIMCFHNNTGKLESVEIKRSCCEEPLTPISRYFLSFFPSHSFPLLLFLSHVFPHRFPILYSGFLEQTRNFRRAHYNAVAEWIRMVEWNCKVDWLRENHLCVRSIPTWLQNWLDFFLTACGKWLNGTISNFKFIQLYQ